MHQPNLGTFLTSAKKLHVKSLNGVHGYTWKIKQNISVALVQTNWYKSNGYNTTFYSDVIFVKDTAGGTSKRYGLPNFHISRPKENPGFVWYSIYYFGV